MSTERPTILLQPEGLRIPADLADLAAFRRWVHSDDFPERGRLDWIGGELEVDVAPEELNTHGTVKVALSGDLRHLLEREEDRGVVYSDRARVSVPAANLSVEPDVVVLLHESVQAGRVKLVPKASAKPDRYIEVEGPPDLVVEVISDSSAGKDNRKLPPRYFTAGVTELWLVDARRDPVRLLVHRRGADDWLSVVADADGFTPSPLLNRAVRLVRKPTPSPLARYELELRG